MPRVRAISDVGAHIPGAKKNALHDRMAINDLLQMSEAEIVTTINKDKVWKKPDYATLVENGMEPRAAALLKIIRDRIAARPVPRGGISAVDNAKDYTEMLVHMRDELEAATSYGEMKSTLSLIRRAYCDPATGKMDYASRLGKKYSSIISSVSPFDIHYSEDKRATDMADKKFYAVREDWQKGFKVYKDGIGQYRITPTGGKELRERFESETAAWDWVKENADQYRAVNPKVKKKITPRYRPHLDHIKREGMNDHRQGRDIGAEEFRAWFNFKGVEFGEWLPDKERQAVLNMAYDSLIDLADVLKVDPKAVSLDGTLSVAFGSRGKGNAAAEYQPAFHIYNLTRLQGAGATAHEWLHALSYYLAWGTDTLVGKGLPAAAGGDFRPGREQIQTMLAHRGGELAAACADMVDALEKRPMKARERIIELDNEIAGHVSQGIAIERTRVRLEKAERLTTAARKELKELPNRLNNAAMLIMKKTKLRDHLATIDPDEIVGTCKSEFFIRAEDLDRQRSGEAYYTRREELFARAFETYVFDKIAAVGGVSQYLVHGVSEQDYDPEIYHGSPYIGGETRTYMNGVMEKFVEALGPVLSLEETPTPKI
jgi:hypothetical protein